jgi:hypothetical protein
VQDNAWWCYSWHGTLSDDILCKIAERKSANVTAAADTDADVGAAQQLRPLPRPLRVCLMTGDFWGLPGASGTATAYGLLAGALEADPSLQARASDV